MQTLFDAVGGMEGLRRLAEAWHRRVMADEVVAHAFSHGFHPQHVERLAAYWAEALGGPTIYSDFYGNETIVVKMFRAAVLGLSQFHFGSTYHGDLAIRVGRRFLAAVSARL